MTGTPSVRRLLVPTDLSDHATAAVRYASLLASRLGAGVSLLHATTFRPSTAPVPAEGGVLVQTYEENDRLLFAALEKTRAEHLRQIGASLEIVDGRPAEAILANARNAAADMIVMGTHGREGLARAILGSVAEEVIRRSAIPVLTVRNAAPDAVTRVLCPIDYSDAAARAFRHALLFASAFDAELVALCLQENGWSNDDIEDEVERVRLWLGDVPLSVRLTCLARRGDAATQLNEYAGTHGVDLVVAGAQPRRGPGLEATIGTTTETLTRHAPCPVLTMPAGSVLVPAGGEREWRPGKAYRDQWQTTVKTADGIVVIIRAGSSHEGLRTRHAVVDALQRDGRTIIDTPLTSSRA